MSNLSTPNEHATNSAFKKTPSALDHQTSIKTPRPVKQYETGSKSEALRIKDTQSSDTE